MIGESENRRGLGRRVFILYPVGTLVAAVVLVTAFSFYVLEVMRSAAYDENRNAVSVATVQVESWLGPYTNTMAGFRRSIEKQQLGDAAVRATLSSYFNRRPGVSEAFFGTSEGRFYTASGWAPHPNVAEPRTKDWYLEAARNFGLVSTGPAPSRKDGVPVITFSMPVGQKKERIRGVLGVDVQVSAFEEQMAQAIQKKPGLFLIVDNSSDSLLGHVPRSEMGSEVSRDSVYRRLQEIMPFRNAIPLSQGQGAYFLYDDPVEKDEWYVCVVRFPNYPFDAIYLARKSDVLSSVHSRMIDVIVVASMGILLLIGITTLVGRYLFSKTLGKALEESVRSSTLFESMLDSRYVSLVLTDSDFHVLHASSNIARLAGSTDWRSLRQSSLWDVIPNPEFRLFAERCREDETAAEQEKTLLLPVQDQQGDTLWWNFAFRTFVDSDVKIRYLILVSDETGNVRKSTILDAVMESAQSALVILDGDSRISYLSRTAVLHSGWSAEKLVGASLDSLELLGIPAPTITELVASENAGTGWSGNFSMQHHGLSKSWFRGEASVLQAHGRRIGYMIVLADITEVVNARQEAEQATRAKSDFLANMSHEIRTPMNAIIGMSHLVLSSELPARQKDYVEKIDRAARSLLGIINDILDLSKIEARKVILENTAIDLPRQLSDVLNLAEIRIADKPIELLLDLDPALPRQVLGDPLRLSQILTNLLGNASKFTPQGQILLSVRNVSPLPGDDLLVQFSVVDTGIGMNAEQIARLFVAFSQADGSITRKFGGTGLGLTISQSFVELMGGRIIVDSIPGVGSDFHFTIPMKAAPESVITMSDPLPPGDILCLSTSAELRRIVRENLHFLGKPTYECEQADHFLPLLEEHSSVRWIIADAEWIASDFSDVLSPLRHDRDKYNVILLTGNKIDDATCDWLAANGFAFQLRKPFNGLQLQDMLRTSLLDPATVTRDAPSIPRNATVYQFQPARILLVEDNQFNQQLVVDLLADTGLIVDLADHGEMGFEKVRDNHYDLVLMDVQMPILDGYGSTRKIRSLQDPSKAKIPILAMSAHALAGDAEKSMSAGMDGHITKPIEPALLFQVLARWLPCSLAGKNQGPNVADKVLTTDRLLSVLPPSLGFDPNVGIRRVGGQPGQYVRQLRRFCQDFRQTPALLRETVHRGEWLDATRIAHTFKGVSGTIGAERLSELAAYLEEQCRKNSIDQDLLDVFFVEHSGLLQYILTRLEKLPDSDTLPIERSHTGTDALRQLARILVELEEPVAENAPSTCQTILLDAAKLELPDAMESELKLLAEAIGSFNFDSASELRVQMSHKVQEALRV